MLFRIRLVLVALSAALLPAAGCAQVSDDTVVQAREALRKKDRAALATAAAQTTAARHPLAMWVAYWELGNRLQEAQQPELDAFYARWPGTYVEDRLRNDWLLELGRRRDWVNFRVEYPRFRMNDDREVACYAVLTRHFDGADVRADARAAWLAQREFDDGCDLMARTLFEARVLVAGDAWDKARASVEANRPRAARAAIALASPGSTDAVNEALDNPARYLARRTAPAANGSGAGSGAPATNASGGAAPSANPGAEMVLLALMRMAANDPEATASQLDAISLQRLPLPLAATAWAHVARQSAIKLQPQAAEYVRRGWKLWDASPTAALQPPWSDDVLAFHVRAALRQPSPDGPAWPLVMRSIGAMSAAEQRDPSWVYWQARATVARSMPGAEGDTARAAARAALESVASPHHGFYGQLATEELGGRVVLPPPPAALTPAEREAPRQDPGFARALQLIAIGLRNEGVREWNFMLRGLGDRELLAAAQLACDREVWDRCINTSERTRREIDVAQRFPMPFRPQVTARARDAGLEPAVVYGLIRQESRFLADVRSHVGATGLMQLMPATAQWTARKLGVDYRADLLTDPQFNLQLGSDYLRRVLDQFGGSTAMAAAAYNAGPGRPRRWREGSGALEPALWAETIPFTETRDYVKKVLSNSVTYAALLGAPAPTLKARLGPPIGPREPGATVQDREIP